MREKVQRSHFPTISYQFHMVVYTPVTAETAAILPTVAVK